jgi:hypothetical protein
VASRLDVTRRWFYADYDAKLYGNVIIARRPSHHDKPAAIMFFASLQQRQGRWPTRPPPLPMWKARDGIVNVPLETRRL